MRRIHKGAEPRSLREHRRSGGDYDGYAGKDELREALLKEQGFLCCYCMRRISAKAMKIEHWASQADNEDKLVDYDNLLGACTGGEGQPPRLQTCDTHKGKSKLTVHPARVPPDCTKVVQYPANGEAKSEDGSIHQDLHVTLNLNTETLVKNRRNVILRVITELSSKQKNGTWPDGFLEKERLKWTSLDGEGKHLEYCQVAVYYLEKKLKKKA